MIANHKINQMYSALTPTERARLMAQINRQGRYDELGRLADALPSGQTEHWNKRLHILRHVHSPLAPNVGVILLSAELTVARLAHALTELHQERLRHYSLGDIWRLVRYPVTEAEYTALIELDRARLTPLDDFAGFMVQSMTTEEAAADGWRLEVIPLLEGEEAWLEERAIGQARALLSAAVAAGGLPQPLPGAELGQGILMDWLRPGQVYEIYSPAAYVPTVELLGGNLFARWEIRPDSEADAVHARREEIASALFASALLDPLAWPSIHPPTALEEQDQARTRVNEGWPWQREREVLHKYITYLGVQHAATERNDLDQHLAILTEITEQDFCGEDPVPPLIRTLLAQTQEHCATVAELWTKAGDALSDPDWPPLPVVVPESAAWQLRDWREIYRERTEAG